VTSLATLGTVITTRVTLVATQVAVASTWVTMVTHTTTFDHLGQFIDNDAGALYVCSLNIIY
jgi:hypothetical protein